MTDPTSQHLTLEYAVASALAGAESVGDAAPALLEAIGNTLDLDIGLLWLPGPHGSDPVLAPIASWVRPTAAPSRFVEVSGELTFARGVGLPGRVWETAEPEGIDDPSGSGYTRAAIATSDRVTAGFAFPILREALAIGVVEFYSKRDRGLDGRFLESTRSIGRQIGQFVERTRAEQAVRDSEALKSAILQAALDCIVTIDHRGIVRDFNPAAERTFGYRQEDVIGHELADLIVPEHLREAHRQGLARYLASGTPRVIGQRVEIEAMRSDGSLFPVELAISKVDIGGVPAFTAYIREITDRLDGERQLREAEERYRTLVERLPAIVYVAETGAQGRWTYVSPGIEATLGFTVEEWLGDPHLWARQIHPDDRASVVSAEEAILGRPDDQALATEYRMLTKNGDTVWVRDEMVPTSMGDGRPVEVRGIMVDITQQKLLEERLTQHAFYDPLTNLPNRVLFMERLEHALTRQGRPGEALLAVMFLDVDDFKVINDTLGHEAGDLVLASIGERLGTVVRRVDTAARFGGDEFTLLLEGIDEPSSVVPVAQRVAELFAEPFRVNDHEITLSASLGIAVASGDRTTAEELVRHADIAMYRAKQNGKARFEIYHEQLSVEAWRRLELEAELRRAIDRGELRVHYQPIVSLDTGGLTGVEALVRWQHPTRGLLSPSEFVAFAEANGLIVPIDRFVLTEACRNLVAWSAEAPAAAGELTVSVNLSAREFRSPGIVEVIAGILGDSGLAARRLKIEITESVTLLDSEITDAILAGLGDLGVRLVIDDFGVGYSGLDYVKRFAVDALKIDRSFVAGLGHSREDAAIVSATIAFARALDLSVTAEGIETEAQLQHLLELGCESGQGYLFSHPVPGEQLRRQLVGRGAA